MPEATAPFELSAGDKRRLRLTVETYYDVQDVRMRTENRIRQAAEFEGLAACIGEAEAFRLRMAGTDTLVKEINKYKPNKAKKFGGDPQFVLAYDTMWSHLEDAENHKKLNWHAREQEKILKNAAMSRIREHPIWTEWLERVNGIGPCLAGGWLGITDPSKAATMSAYWRYCGLAVTVSGVVCLQCKVVHEPEDAPGPACPKCQGTLSRIGTAERRVKGKKTTFNPRAKTLAWKTGSQFVRTAKSGYQKLYKFFREEIEKKPCTKVHLDTTTKKEIPCFAAHKHGKAVRMVSKIFAGHFWQIYRSLAGLPVPKPYAYGVLGHDESRFIEPIVDKEPILPLAFRKPWEATYGK